MRLRAHANVTAVVQPAPHVRERLEAMKAEAGGATLIGLQVKGNG